MEAIEGKIIPAVDGSSPWADLGREETADEMDGEKRERETS